MMHTVLLATVPRTGTRLIGQFFKNMPEITHDINLHDLAKNPAMFQSPFGSGLIPSGGNLVVGHFDRPNISHIQLLSQFWRPVTTLKDPLFTMLSMHERTKPENCKETDTEPDPHQKNGDPLFMPTMWNSFMWAVNAVKPFCICVDLLDTTEERVYALSKACEAAGISLDVDYIEKFAKEWPPTNTLGSYPLKDAYLAGDMEAIEAELPREVAILRAMEPQLRPMLEVLGYENLMWWS